MSEMYVKSFWFNAEIFWQSLDTLTSKKISFQTVISWSSSFLVNMPTIADNFFSSLLKKSQFLFIFFFSFFERAKMKSKTLLWLRFRIPMMRRNFYHRADDALMSQWARERLWKFCCYQTFVDKAWNFY